MSLGVFDPVTNLPGVGPKIATLLENLHISTIEDLLWHVPVRFQDRSITDIDQLTVGETYTIGGTISHIQSRRLRGRKSIQTGVITDDTGSINLTWFNQPFLVKSIPADSHITATGKVGTFRNTLSLTVSEYAPTVTAHINTGQNTPIYQLTKGITQKWLRSIIKRALTNTNIEEWLPPSVVEEHSLESRQRAFQHIHFPSSNDDFALAQARLGFEELYLLQLRSQINKSIWQSHQNTHQIKKVDISPFTDSLPFTLTSAQSRIIKEIQSDLSGPIPMNRLIQGDVGSGKTAIAAAAIYACKKEGLRSILMAPTLILARQHAESLKKMFRGTNISVSLQTNQDKEALDRDVIVGTHAILHRQIPEDIGLVIIDEQHRFGVNQRTKLLELPKTPNLLSLTATPIPRTIALTIYADLDVSVVDELPPGRIPIKTWVVPNKKRADAYEWIEKEITTNKAQVFVVCPLIEPSEAMPDIKNVEEELENIKKIFKNHKIKSLHGRTKPSEKTKIINDFSQHKFDILVATPVIEVGIDIRDATIMLIESAERFGLAALHQLRGRVGRNNLQSYCLLFSNNPSSKRLAVMQDTHLGMELAEYDLKHRGAGEVFGTKQSGHVAFKVASFHDVELITKTHQSAVNTAKTINNPKDFPHIYAHLNYSLEKNQLAD